MAGILFSHSVLRNFIENSYNKPIFSQYHVFYKYKHFFFQPGFLILFQSSPEKSIKSGTVQPVLKVTIFSHCVVHSLRAVKMFFNIFSEIERHRSFTTQNSRLCYFL